MELKKKTDLSKKKQLNDIGRYAGLGLQMMLTILALTALGNWADNYFRVHYPLFTLSGAVLGIATSMYWLFRSTSKN